MNSFLPFFVLLLVLDVLPVAVLVWRVLARGRAVGVPAGVPAGFAFFLGMLGGMGLQGATARYLVDQAQQMQPTPRGLETALVLLTGPLGATLAAGAVYLHFRMMTTHDPDYEELPAPPPSDVADVGQPGDGGHVRPE